MKGVSHSSNVKPLLYFLAKMRKRPRSIMDLGCGKGNIGVAINSKFDNINVFGADLNLDYVEFARSRKFLEFQTYEAVFWEDIRFLRSWGLGHDLYLAFNVLGYMQKEEALKLINSLRGKLIVSVPVEREEDDGVLCKYQYHWTHSEISELSRRCLYRGRILGVYVM